MNSRFSQGLKTLGSDKPRKDSAPASSRDMRETTPSLSGQEHSLQQGYIAPSRVGKKAITGYFDPAVRQQLAVLAAEEDRSQNDLIAEALNTLFERYRKPPIAKG